MSGEEGDESSGESGQAAGLVDRVTYTLLDKYYEVLDDFSVTAEEVPQTEVRFTSQ